MLLLLDVGNTNIVVGVMDGRKVLADWRIRTERDITADELGILMRNLFISRDLKLSDVTDVIISNVVPPVQNVLEWFAEKYLKVKPLFVGPNIEIGMPILYDNPKEVGADRIVNAVAAYEEFRCALIIVDFGTATTFDYVSPQGEYVGGAIAPGLGLSSEALFQKASKLPRIELFARPKTAVGRDTVSSMTSGLVFGYAGLVDGIVARILDEVKTDPKVVATGGLAPLIASLSKYIEKVIPDLTLEGLRLIYERNRPEKSGGNK